MPKRKIRACQRLVDQSGGRAVAPTAGIISLGASLHGRLVLKETTTQKPAH
jgi:hypothetical protein